MLEGEIRLVVEDARVVECRAVVELIEGDDVVVVGICDDEMAYEPTGAALSLRGRLYPDKARTYIKPAPPVTRMFFASGNGSNLVLPSNTGACFHSSS
jgi:hypothetical protein